MRKFYVLRKRLNGNVYIYFPISRCSVVYDLNGDNDFIGNVCFAVSCRFNGFCKDCPYTL